MNGQTADTEFIILENIYGSSGGKIPLRQRDLARIAGASLGMTNAVIKRLARKGWISVKKLNSRNISYAVTPEGIREIARRGYGYFKRTVKNVAYYRESLEELLRRARGEGITGVFLAGASDLDFIVEHLCRRYGLSFLKPADPGSLPPSGDGHTLTIFPEHIPAPTPPEAGPEGSGDPEGRAFYLSQLVMKKTAGEAP